MKVIISMGRFEELWERYLTDRLTEQELKEFLGMLREQDGTALQEIEGLLQENSYKGLAFEQTEERIFNSLMRKAARPLRLVTMRSWTRVAAVAAILIVIAVSTVLLLNKPGTKMVAESPRTDSVVTDIPPGGEKAILTLADGTKVILDTAANGAVTQQGGMTVIKTDGLVSYTNTGNTTQVFSNTISTPRGGQYQLVLADGTKVWLNAASSITFPTAFTGPDRRVEIQGEAYFEVASNLSMPFKVLINDVEVRVLGTHFNINSYSDEPQLKITLLEGLVDVMQQGGAGTVRLKPGAQARIADGSMRVARNVDLEDVIAWKEGNFSFEYATIREILREFSRWYNVEIVIQGAISDKDEFFLIGSRNTPLSSAIKGLKEGGPDNISYQIRGNKLIVQSVRNK